MIRFRPFRNDDPPAISAIWRSQHPSRALAPTMSPAVLDRMVLSKPYFDRRGLVVAESDEGPVGFAHAAFGSDAAGATIDHRVGVICMLMVTPHERSDEVAHQLRDHCESYLRGHGAECCYAGGHGQLANPFYLGLFGGSQLAGQLSSYDEWRDLFAPHGYSPCGVRRVMQLSLAGFRPPISRDLMQIRRKYVLEARLDPQPKTWWEACTDGYENRTRFSLAPRSPHSPCGQATFWDMEPLASSWGVHAAGLIEIEVDDALRRTGVASFLLGESLRQLQSQGVTLVEAQVDDEQTAAFALLVKLGFKQIDEGRILKKKLVAES